MSEGMQALSRGLLVLRALSHHKDPQSPAALATETGLSRATVTRAAVTLEELGYVRRDADGIHLTPRVLELGAIYLTSAPLPSVALPHMEALSLTTGYSTSLGIRDDDAVRYVQRVRGTGFVHAHINLGTRITMHDSALGRVLLASETDAEVAATLDRIGASAPLSWDEAERTRISNEIVLTRQRGWGYVDGEFEPGLVTLAVPVHGPGGEVRAALNLPGQHAGLDADTGALDLVMTELHQSLKETAGAITRDLATFPGAT